MGFLWVIQFPPTVQIRLTGYSKFPIGVKVCVNGCSSLYWCCKRLAILPDDIPRLLPEVTWDWLQHHRDPDG